MFLNFLKMAVGAVLIFSSFYIMIIRLRACLVNAFPRLKFLAAALSLIGFISVEVIGIHLLIDPIIPGQALINIHAEDLVMRDPTPYDLRVVISVVDFGGNLDRDKKYGGRFDQQGIYSLLANFGWLQNYMRVTIYRQTRPDTPIFVKWQHVSALSRLGLTETHIYLSR